MKESIYKDYNELPVFLNARMVADLLGVSQSTAYELMHEKNFPTLHVGSRLVVPRDAFLDWMNGKISR
ncbi:MAG: helix-turn-helix domain-containing protein [Oscillospiraceae bacterium]|nr:helix-turn-helix domain-containing protein [Oscillospiraceae bacterium]